MIKRFFIRWLQVIGVLLIAAAFLAAMIAPAAIASKYGPGWVILVIILEASVLVAAIGDF